MEDQTRAHDAGPRTRDEPLLRLERVTKRFPGVVALADVDISIAAGEIVALTGENGSGKSTLAKIVGGITQPDEGEIFIDGVPRRIPSPHAATAHGIVMISQELTLAPTLSGLFTNEGVARV